jgi:hypothetical protein
MHMSPSRPAPLRRAAVALVAVLALPLAGCGADATDNPPAAQPTATVEPSASPTSATGAPTPTDPVPPAPRTTAPPAPRPDRSEPSDRRRPPVSGEVVLSRSGGFIGVDQTLVVYADGAWAYQEGRGEIGKPLGKLSADQRRQLRALANSPALRSEAGNRSGPGVCNDGYVYALRASEVNVSWNDCGSAEPATAARIAALLISWTPM